MLKSIKDNRRFFRFKNLAKYIMLPMVLSCSFYPLYAETVDDVRELLGRERVDKRFTEAEILEVTKNYMLAEQNNLIAEMFKIGESIKMDNYEADKIQLLTAIDMKKDELNKAYATVQPLDEVLRIKTELDSLMSDVARLKEVGYEVKVEYEPNPYTEDYMKIQGLVEELGEQYDIGDVGIDMKSPVLGSFVITSPFGTRLDPFTGEATIHNGLDLAAQHREPVLWNGIVTRAYFSESAGNMVEISHGKDLVTRYMHMDELNVKAGDYVNQYDIIGYAGSTGRSTGTHLHIEVKVDGITVNPLMFYGSKGLNALKTWISLNPNQLEDTSFMENIKDRPEDLISEVEEIVNRGYQSYVVPEYIRGESKKELSYKESMELGEFVEEETVKFKSDEKIVKDGVVEIQLPEDYKVPIPGIPYLDEAQELEKNENINESDIKDFNEFGQIYVQDSLYEDTEEKEVGEEEEDDDDSVKSFHLKITREYD